MLKFIINYISLGMKNSEVTLDSLSILCIDGYIDDLNKSTYICINNFSCFS